MDFLYYLVVAIAVLALTLIINLFFSLKKTDELYKEAKERIAEVEETPLITTKKTNEKQGKSLKSLKNEFKKNDLKDFKHGLLVTNLKGHINCANAASYSSNGKLLVSCDGEQSIMVWNVKDFNKGNTVFRVNTDYEVVSSVNFSPDSKAVIAALESANKTRVFKVVKREGGYSCEQIGSDNPDYNTTSSLTNADIGVQFQSGIQSGAFLFHSYKDNTVVITDLRGSILGTVHCAKSTSGHISLSNCGRYFGYCGDSAELRVWAIIFKSGVFTEIKKMPSLCGHKGKLTAFCFSPDSSRIVTLSADSIFKVWNMDVEWLHGHPPQEIVTFENSFGPIENLAISPDNMTVAAIYSNNATVFSLVGQDHYYVYEKIFVGKIKTLNFDPTSNFIAVTGDKNVRIFENYVGWLARLSEYGKKMQLASNDTHLNRLKELTSEASKNIKRMKSAIQ